MAYRYLCEIARKSTAGALMGKHVETALKIIEQIWANLWNDMVNLKETFLHF